MNHRKASRVNWQVFLGNIQKLKVLHWSRQVGRWNGFYRKALPSFSGFVEQHYFSCPEISQVIFLSVIDLRPFVDITFPQHHMELSLDGRVRNKYVFFLTEQTLKGEPVRELSRTLLAKTDDLTLIPWIHMVGGENWLLSDGNKNYSFNVDWEREKFLGKPNQGETLSRAHCSSPSVSFTPFFLSQNSSISAICSSVLDKHWQWYKCPLFELYLSKLLYRWPKVKTCSS